MKVLMWILGAIILNLTAPPAEANEVTSAVKRLRSDLVRISQQPKGLQISDARRIFDQKLNGLQRVSGEIEDLSHVVLDPSLSQALGNAQNILARVLLAPSKDPMWSENDLVEVTKIAGLAATALNVNMSRSVCADDLLSNPLQGDTL